MGFPIHFAWLFGGTAAGGSVEFTVGVVSLEVVTTAGQTAAQVAAAVAAAINADPTLSAEGITATASGGLVQTNGPITSTAVNDSGLTQTFVSPPRVPALTSWGIALVLSLLMGTVLWMLRGRRRASTV